MEGTGEMKRLMIAILVIALGCLVGCSQRSAVKRWKPVSEVTVRETAPELHFASGVDYSALEKENAKVKPSVPAYTVKPGLANVVNSNIYGSLLEPKLKDMIVRNGFAVTPTDYIQMFEVYENNQYQRPKYPSFITTDSMLHTYHIFYDYTLRKVESNKLYDAAVSLTKTMLAASQQDLKAASDPKVKDAAMRNTAYFAVARKLLTGIAPPPEVAEMANADLKLIDAHEGRAVSAVMGCKVEFSQFVPRGHYTRSEKLKKYFRAMMWYGLTPFAIPQGKIGPQPTRQALLIVRFLESDKPALKLWDTIYEPTVFYVGSADDYTVRQYAKIMHEVYGSDPAVGDFADKAKLDTFISEVKKLPGPGIESFVAVSRAKSEADPWYPVGRQFRFMGQRFIPDSRILQELTHPKVKGRNFPKGLDVFAAMGSERALDILNNFENLESVPGWTKQMAKMRKEMRETPLARWQSNLYYGWLWSLQPITAPVPEGYPSVMRSDAWLDKSLFTALGSWTELRHDTILYAKQSVAECGGDGEELPVNRNYVEPNLEFWTRLQWLNSYTKAGLSGRHLLDENLKGKFDTLGDWIEFCRRITIKELTGKRVTDEEYSQMDTYGADLEALTLSFAEGDIISDTDKDQAVVADVHTSFGKCLEEGTGRVAAIYVVVPIEGKLYLTRGATYTQYEFEWPKSDRLTDEKWQQMLETGTEPGFADWTRSFLVPTKKKPAPEFESYFGGC